MKISSCLLGLIGLVWALYCLFQPIVDMNFGWEKISKDVFDQKFKGIELKEYQEEVTKAKRFIDSIHTKSYSPSISIAAMINMNKGGIKGSFPMFDYVTPIAEVFITKLRTK